LRILGIAAVAGGVLRIGNSFAPATLGAGTLEVLYFVTDVLLLFGLCGLQLGGVATSGWSGRVGFALGVVGILVIRSAALFGASGYMIGAGLLLFGLLVWSVAALVRRGAPRLAPILWLSSLVLAGVGALAPGLTVPTALAGVAFGLGFVVAGMELSRARG
jgi:hypothetical protein